MKRIISPICALIVALQLMAVNYSNAQTGTWTKLTNMSPHENMGVMLLLTNGSVMCHDTVGGEVGQGWDLLTPDASGSYVNGTWSTIASMHRDRFAFSSQVLPSGNVWVAGGEYGAGDTASELYTPLTNIWTIVPGDPVNRRTPWNIYDAPSELLYTGVVLDGPEIGADPSFDCLFYTPSTNRLTVAPTAPLNHDEAQWLKLPDSSVLFVGIASENSTRYIPQTNTWITDANLPVNIYDPYGEESGCGLMLPNGKAIFFGATVNNCIYTPTGNHNPGTWAAAATFPTISGTGVGQPDAPGAMMVNGHILLAVSPIGTSQPDEFRTPTWFVEYDYTTNTFTQVTSIIPGIGSDSLAGIVSQQLTFLNLPDGNVLIGLDQDYGTSTQYWIYTPGSGPIAQGKPTINSILPDGCPNYKITGKLFNGISEGTSFGDDLQNATNYPIIRLTDGTNVYYARTSNWNRIGAIQTDSLEDTAVFTTPANLPSGTYSLVVVVNGFASNPTLFTVLGISSIAETNITCSNPVGSASVTASGGLAPLTYAWNPGGNTSTTVSNLTAGTYTVTVTDNNGCTATSSAVITSGGAGSINVSTQVTDISCNGGTDGSATANISGGTSPFTYSWSAGGGTNSAVSGLSAGTYTLTILDSCGSSGTATAVITQPGVLSMSIDSLTNINCFGNSDGSITANAATGGTSPYNYSWTSGGGTNLTASGLSAGSYMITVTDNNGCTATASAAITQPATSVSISIASQTNVNCNGGTNGTATADSASGGTSPYVYSWTSGGGSNLLAANLSAGTYTITATDFNGCSASGSVAISQPLALSISADSMNATSGNCDGSAWAVVSGGTSAYTYSWTGGLITDTITNQCTGSYCCIVTDANGCIDSVCINISVSTGISTLQSNGQLLVYPNPNNGEFIIEASGVNGQCSLEIYNVLGQKVTSEGLLSTINKIDLSTQPSGIYLYRVIMVKNGNLIGEGKIVIQK